MLLLIFLSINYKAFYPEDANSVIISNFFNTKESAIKLNSLSSTIKILTQEQVLALLDELPVDYLIIAYLLYME